MSPAYDRRPTARRSPPQRVGWPRDGHRRAERCHVDALTRDVPRPGQPEHGAI